MRSYLNIERSAFKRGEYVGYGGEGVWHIYRRHNGWRAWNDTRRITFTRRTLAEVSQALAMEEFQAAIKPASSGGA